MIYSYFILYLCTVFWKEINSRCFLCNACNVYVNLVWLRMMMMMIVPNT